MNPLTIILILVIVILISLSALFSASETAYSSLNIIRIKQRAKKGDKRAREVYQVASNYSALITTVLICNNVVNISATSVISYLFSVEFKLGAQGIGYATVIMTFLIIIFGEITPKIVARQNAVEIALITAHPLKVLIKFLKPLTKRVTKLEEKIKGDKKKQCVTATESELLEIVQTIEFEGVLNQDERELIESAISFDNKKVEDIMTYKNDVTCIYDDASYESIKKVILEHKYSRIPVMSKKTKEIIGVMHEADVLESIILNKKIEIKSLIREIVVVTAKRRLPLVLEKLQKSKAHMAVVVDNLKEQNYIGIVTLEDILEELVGEIYDEYDDLPENVVEIGLHSYEIDPNIKVVDFFKEYIEETKPPKIKSKTFVGWLNELNEGKIFCEENEFVYQNIIMKIAEISDNNVIRLDIEVLTKEEEDLI